MDIKKLFVQAPLIIHSLFVLSFVAFGINLKSVSAQESPSVLYVPLIALTAVPEPLALPRGPGNVTYHYAVKNFLEEEPLTDIQVVDDKCAKVQFIEGDDNNNSELDYNETWRYTCTGRLTGTTQSTATATGHSNNIVTTHKAYSTVVVGSSNPPPLVSIINITKVAYPLSLPAQGGKITFTYKVNNPGVVPLSGVTVTDNRCSAMSGKLGDTNGNNLLDLNEVWIYTCTATLTRTTTNTVKVTAFANGLKAVGEATITVKVESPTFPKVGGNPGLDPNPNLNLKIIAWAFLAGILTVLTLFSILKRDKSLKTKKEC